MYDFISLINNFIFLNALVDKINSSLRFIHQKFYVLTRLVTGKRERLEKMIVDYKKDMDMKREW